MFERHPPLTPLRLGGEWGSGNLEILNSQGENLKPLLLWRTHFQFLEFSWMRHDRYLSINLIILWKHEINTRVN